MVGMHITCKRQNLFGDPNVIHSFMLRIVVLSKKPAQIGQSQRGRLLKKELASEVGRSLIQRI